MGSVAPPTLAAFRQGCGPVQGAWSLGTVCVYQTFVSAGAMEWGALPCLGTRLKQSFVVASCRFKGVYTRALAFSIL